jgi:dihydroorotate dehydrogenase
VLYTGLAYNGVRNGAHWAWVAGARSALLGFFSFFLFLGFHYFDPLPALAAVLLFLIFLPGLFTCRTLPKGECGLSWNEVRTGLTNSPEWRRGLFGQLLFVSIGVGLILAGLTIAGVGVTRVFVPQDLMFLMTTREALVSANPHLLPLIAHDRAGFGGALASDGLAVLMLSLWGFRPGARWVWWTLLLAGLPGFAAAVWVHLAIGYMNPVHLAPAYLAILFFSVGLAFSRRMLCRPEPGGVLGT